MSGTRVTQHDICCVDIADKSMSSEGVSSITNLVRIVLASPNLISGQTAHSFSVWSIRLRTARWCTRYCQSM